METKGKPKWEQWNEECGDTEWVLKSSRGTPVVRVQEDGTVELGHPKTWAFPKGTPLERMLGGAEKELLALRADIDHALGITGAGCFMRWEDKEDRSVLTGADGVALLEVVSDGPWWMLRVLNDRARAMIWLGELPRSGGATQAAHHGASTRQALKDMVDTAMAQALKAVEAAAVTSPATARLRELEASDQQDVIQSLNRRVQELEDKLKNERVRANNLATQLTNEQNRSSGLEHKVEHLYAATKAFPAASQDEKLGAAFRLVASALRGEQD